MDNEIVIDISMSKTSFKMRTMVKTVAILAVSTMMFAACGGNASKKQGTETETATETKADAKGNDYADAKAFSVKYEKDGDTYVYTSTVDNKQKRLDHISADGTHIINIMTTNEAGEGSGLHYEDGNWDDVLYAIQKVNEFTLWKSRHLYYKDAGFTKSGNAAVAGANCVLWTGTQKDMGIHRYSDFPIGKPAEIAVWNNKVTMRLKSDGKVILEAKAFSANVPETAFTQTVETTWIK
jgi:hypothetical protein